MLTVLRSQAKCGFGPRSLRKLIPLNTAPDAAYSGIGLRLVRVLTIRRHLKSYLRCPERIEPTRCLSEQRLVEARSSASCVSREVYDVGYCNSSRAAGLLPVCPLPALRLSGQPPQTISNSRPANGLAIVVYVSLSGKKNLGIESEVLLMTERVTQKFNGDETDRDLRKPQRGPESC